VPATAISSLKILLKNIFLNFKNLLKLFRNGQGASLSSLLFNFAAEALAAILDAATRAGHISRLSCTLLTGKFRTFNT
jgi:predicted YcjX-like family ATPase